MFKRFAKQLLKTLRQTGEAKPVPFAPIPAQARRNKTALVSYIRDTVFFDDNSARLNDHTSKWESKEIARILHTMGFDVDVVDYNDTDFYPDKPYDLVFDIHYNIDRLASFLPPHCVKILHITGSYPGFSITEELKRVDALEARTGKPYSPKRVVDNVYFTRSLQKADYCTLFGNAETIATFPLEYQSKLHLVTPTASQMQRFKSAENFTSNRQGFLWLYGAGAVHKGLDLVLEAFIQRAGLQLHIMGQAAKEHDFVNIYGRALHETPNIHYHGQVNPMSSLFSDVMQQVSSFIAPSCSESLSVAAATCMSVGLYPILSRANGIDLPEGCGILLPEVSVESILQAVDQSMALPDEDFTAQISATQAQALALYTRRNFTRNMTAAITQAIEAKR